MTSPFQARTTDTGRYYSGSPYHPGREYVSITTAIGEKGKGDGLVVWGARLAAEKILKLLKKDPEIDPKVAVRLAKTAWEFERDEAARKGDLIHEYMERFFLGQNPKPHPDVTGHAKQFHLWVDSHEIEPLFCEATVYNDALGYAGTADLIARVDGIVTVVDYKSSKSVHAEVALQAAAVANGEYIVTDMGQVLPMPAIERGAVFHVRPRSRKFLELDIGEKTFASFCHLLKVKQLWSDDMAEKAVLRHIAPTR